MKTCNKKELFSLEDCFYLILISTMSICARLWRISQPDGVVFDEAHFGNFTKYYIHHEFHFDIHPPLAKMTMSFISYLQGYRGEVDPFYPLGRKYNNTETMFVTVRMVPAIMSGMCSPLLYCCTKLLGISSFPSFVAASFVALDNSFIVESRFILSDGVLHFYCAFHLFCFALFLRYDNNILAVLAGITLGMAGSSKLTALSLVAIDGVSQIVWIFMKCPGIIDIIVRAICILVPAFLTFYLAWTIHFAVTPINGYHGSYIDQVDKHTIVDRDKMNTYYWGNRVSKSSYLMRIIRWNIVMNNINMKSKIPHPWESRPEYWPFLTDKYVLFYSRPNIRISCMGSPLVYWTSSSCIIISCFALFVKRAGWQNILFIFGWAISYFPFYRIPRTMFHYHYLIPLMFASMNFGALIDKMFRNTNVKNFICMTFFILNVLCFKFFLPYIYGYECSSCTSTRNWLKSWTQGHPRPILLYGEQLIETTKLKMSLPK